jgi:hypothetical protein
MTAYSNATCRNNHRSHRQTARQVQAHDGLQTTSHLNINKKCNTGRVGQRVTATHRVLLIWLRRLLELCSARLFVAVAATVTESDRTWVQVWVMVVRTWVSLEYVRDPVEMGSHENKPWWNSSETSKRARYTTAKAASVEGGGPSGCFGVQS